MIKMDIVVALMEFLVWWGLQLERDRYYLHLIEFKDNFD